LGVAASGAVFSLFFCLSAKVIARRLEEQYSLRLNEELKSYKKHAGNKIFVSREKFDTEYVIYRTLSKIYFDMVKYIASLIPAGVPFYPTDQEVKKQYESGVYKSSLEACTLAGDLLACYAPMIPLELFNRYQEVLTLCKIQVVVFQEHWNIRYIQEKEDDGYTNEERRRTVEINEKWNLLTNTVREYLSALDVI